MGGGTSYLHMDFVLIIIINVKLPIGIAVAQW